VSAEAVTRRAVRGPARLRGPGEGGFFAGLGALAEIEVDQLLVGDAGFGREVLEETAWVENPPYLASTPLRIYAHTSGHGSRATGHGLYS